MKQKVLPLQSSSSAVINNKLYFVTDVGGYLFCLEDNLTSLNYIGRVHNDSDVSDIPAYRIVPLRNKIILLPFYADKIGIYDVEKNEVNELKLPAELNKQFIKFSGGLVCGEKIVCFPYYMKDKICVIDIENEKVDSFKSFDFTRKGDELINDTFSLNNNTIAGLQYGTNMLLTYDYINDSVQRMVLTKDDSKQFHSCFFSDGLAYAKEINSGKIYIYDLANKNIIGIEKTKIINGKIYGLDNRYIILDSYINSDVWIKDIKTNEIRTIQFGGKTDIENKERCLGTAGIINNKLYYFSGKNNLIYDWDENKKMSFKVDVKKISRIKSAIWGNNTKIINEDDFWGIEDFLQFI